MIHLCGGCVGSQRGDVWQVHISRSIQCTSLPKIESKFVVCQYLIVLVHVTEWKTWVVLIFVFELKYSSVIKNLVCLNWNTQVLLKIWLTYHLFCCTCVFFYICLQQSCFWHGSRWCCRWVCGRSFRMSGA